MVKNKFRLIYELLGIGRDNAGKVRPRTVDRNERARWDLHVLMRRTHLPELAALSGFVSCVDSETLADWQDSELGRQLVGARRGLQWRANTI